MHWFFKKKTVHVNSASELKFTTLVFWKKKKQLTALIFGEKKTVHFNEQCDSGAWLHLFSGSSPREAAKCCFYKTYDTAEFLVGPSSIKLRFFFNQMFIYVAAGEVHPQPHYQMVSKSRGLSFYSPSFYFSSCFHV
jgi:hypothetical protein